MLDVKDEFQTIYIILLLQNSAYRQERTLLCYTVEIFTYVYFMKHKPTERHARHLNKDAM
jgi:hypothetical protein